MDSFASKEEEKKEEEEMKKLVLKNYFLWPMAQYGVVDLANWLVQLKLHGKDSRRRTRFVKILAERVDELNAERQKLFDQYGEKNKEGKFVYVDPNGKESIEPASGMSLKMKEGKTEEEFTKEFSAYLNEDYVLDVSPQTKDTIYGVRDIILNTKEEFAGPMASRYAEWCDALENIKKE